MMEDEEDLDLDILQYNTEFLENMKIEKLENSYKKNQTIRIENVKLPTKDLNGNIIQPKKSIVRQDPSKQASQNLEQNSEKNLEQKEHSIEQKEQKESSNEISLKPKLVSKKQNVSLVEFKEELAQVASAIIQDPEANLKEISRIFKNVEISINYSLLTLLQVFKDIIPGYVIRIIEAEVVSKEVARTRNYESSLLSNYQLYLKTLEKYYSSHQNIVVKCMCELLITKTHFNFKLNLMTAVVNALASRSSEICQMATDAVIHVFKNDPNGQVSMELVKLIADKVYAVKYKVLPMAIRTFIELKIGNEINTHKKSGKDSSTKKRKQDTQYFSKKTRKINKHLKQVEEEFREAEAVYDKKEVERFKSESLKFVFLTYFRILKNSPGVSVS